jgi:hypothetical protein
MYGSRDGDPLVLRIPIKADGTAGEPVPLPYGFSAFDGIELDDKGNIYVSEILLNQIWVLSPDGSQRILIATKQNAPLDNNTSLVLKGDVLCTANLGFTHAKPEEADRTVVCMKGRSYTPLGRWRINDRNSERVSSSLRNTHWTARRAARRPKPKSCSGTKAEISICRAAH